MNAKLVLSVLSAVALGASVFAEEPAKPKELKVLMIGNSFSICCLRQMPQVAKAMDLKLDLVSLYIGGCSLERHCQNVEVGRTNAMFRPYTVSWNYASLADQSKVPFAGDLSDNVWKNWQGEHKEKKGNIPALLKGDKWDVVTIQQASHFSWKPHTYHPWGDDLVKTVRELAPQAKIYVQETWSYPPWDKRLKEFGLDSPDMYARLHNAYADFAKGYGFPLIYTGLATELVSDRDSLFTAPDFHLNRVGEYLQGLVWVGALFGADVTKCTYRPDFVDEDRAAELKNAAQTCAEVTAAGWSTGSVRAFRPARVTRGNTNILKLQPIDDAQWLWMPGDAGMTPLGERAMGGHPSGGAEAAPVFLKFRKEFEATAEEALVLDVSADERFVLRLDGAVVGRGPNRSTVENWQYQTYVCTLKPGKHVLEATVWKICDKGPLAQLSWRGGFILKASGTYDELLTTGKAKWQVGKVTTMQPAGADNGVWGTGSQWLVTGAGHEYAEPAEWQEAESVRGPAGAKGPMIWGGRTNGWMLFPSQLPDQTETKVCPGKVVAVTKDAPWRGKHVYTAEEAKATVDVAHGFSVPANTKMQLACDLGRYICAYPEVSLSGGKGAKVSLSFSEATLREADGKKGSEPGARDTIVGRYLDGYGDTFVADGREGGVFTVPWFRCGKWCRVDIETGDEPLKIDCIRLIESRYPLEMESEFSSPDDPSLADIRRIAARAMQMCCHETLFDCPYYEQQMYPGDTRVQLNVISALSRDDRMIKRAIELYDLGTRDDGQCPFNWPTRGTQEGGSYTLCYLLMHGDYVMNHADRDWLKARLPGFRKSLAGIEYYEDKDGLIVDLPGWNFMDWVVGWDVDGTAPGCRFGEGYNAEMNLLWLLDMQSAAKVETALGNDLQAQYWLAKAEKLKAAIVKKFWDADRGLFVDNPSAKTKCFSEHAQCLALLGDVLSEEESKALFEKLITEEDLKRCTVYFSYYLFDCYFKFGRGDMFLMRLDLWRDYVKKGLTTTQEAPDSGKNGQNESRSDCHAWGAHPIWFMQTGLAGIRSDAPFFAKVKIAPCPGGLKELHAKHPHPKGWITVDLKFDGDAVKGTVSTPVPGVFEYAGRKVNLKNGVNSL